MNTIIPSLDKVGNNSKDSTQYSFNHVEAIRQEIRLLSKSDQSIKNILATFNQLLKQDFIHANNLKDRFCTNFEQLRCDIKAHIQKTGKNRQWASHINDIRDAADKVYAFNLSGMLFHEAVLCLCKRKWGYTASVYELFTLLGVETGVPKEAIRGWHRKKGTPTTRKGVEYVSRIDNFFQAKGELLKKINIVSGIKQPLKPRKEYYHFPIPDKLKKQLDDYINFRIDGILPNRKVIFGNEMGERGLRSLKNLKGKEKWTRDGAGDCHTKKTFLHQVQSYCNVVAKESKNFEEKINWDIRLLFNHEWLYRYKESCKARGILTISICFFNVIHHECAPNSYISTYHAFTKNRERWLKEITLLKEECSAYSIELNNLKDHDGGKKNVAFLLASENIDELIISIANELDRRETYFSGYLKMSATLVAVCFRMLLELPLRVKNMCQLKYIENFELGDEHFISWPSLFFDQQRKAYRVVVPKKFLKNRNSIGINKVDYCYSDFLTPFITKYLNSRKEFFEKYNICCSYFFFMVHPARSGLGKEPTAKTLGHIFSKTTYKALVTLWGNFVEKHCIKGINIHAMRHLSATLFLKHHPENYTALATLLMDDLSTVIALYAKRDDSGNFKKIRKFSEKFWNNQLKGGNNE